MLRIRHFYKRAMSRRIDLVVPFEEKKEEKKFYVERGDERRVYVLAISTIKGAGDMYFYVDERGQIWLNLYYEAQPILHHGVLSAPADLNVTARTVVESLRVKLGVDRMHANLLGVDMPQKTGSSSIKHI